MPKAPFPPLALVLLCALAVGCASAGPPIADCRSLVLDPAPLWVAGAAWSPSGDELLVLDPEGRDLIVYDLHGRFLRRLADDDVAALEFHNPLRLELQRGQLVLGDRTRLVRLDRDLHAGRPVFDGVEGVEEVFLSDWTREGDAVVAYADLRLDEETWRRGFVRLERDGWRMLHELPLELGGEYERYYRYDARPYVVRAGGEVYVLRYVDPPTVYRAGRRGLEEVWRAEGVPGEVTRLLADGERLFVLSLERHEVEGAEPAAEAPRHLAQHLDAATLARAEQVLEEDVVHHLTLLDVDRGRPRWTRRLPTTERAVAVVPGERAWALIAGSGDPDVEGEGDASITLLPSDWYRRPALPTSCRVE